MQLRGHLEMKSRLLGARGQHLGALLSSEGVSRLATLPCGLRPKMDVCRVTGLIPPGEQTWQKDSDQRGPEMTMRNKDITATMGLS